MNSLSCGCEIPDSRFQNRDPNTGIDGLLILIIQGIAAHETMRLPESGIWNLESGIIIHE
jgi:hypothetical protein